MSRMFQNIKSMISFRKCSRQEPDADDDSRNSIDLNQIDK